MSHFLGGRPLAEGDLLFLRLRDLPLTARNLPADSIERERAGWGTKSVTVTKVARTWAHLDDHSGYSKLKLRLDGGNVDPWKHEYQPDQACRPEDLDAVVWASLHRQKIAKALSEADPATLAGVALLLDYPFPPPPTLVPKRNGSFNALLREPAPEGESVCP